MTTFPFVDPLMGPVAGLAGDDPAPTAPDMSVVVIAHERTVDAAAGFDKMAEKAEPHFRPVAERFLGLHQRHALILAGILRKGGIEPDEDGTLMGTINRAVVATRAFLDEIDEDVMAQVRRGEAHVVEAYENALHAGLPDPDRQVIADLHEELTALLAETRHLS
ncbi:MAG: DUF2383 domain-containing protein [Paracoccaceae bacterium]|nr:MAG: DUF2383 domain-containing protein [Paracoccaceae bacterium]